MGYFTFISKVPLYRYSQRVRVTNWWTQREDSQRRHRSSRQGRKKGKRLYQLRESEGRGARGDSVSYTGGRAGCRDSRGADRVGVPSVYECGQEFVIPEQYYEHVWKQYLCRGCRKTAEEQEKGEEVD
jgi:hypothetical protein